MSKSPPSRAAAAAADLARTREVFLAAQSGDLGRYTDLQRLEAMRNLLAGGRLETYAPVLPLVFNHNGKPYHLGDHFPFEPLFNKHIPANSAVKSGRQVSKCRSLSSTDFVYAADGRPLRPDELTPGTLVLSLDDNLRATTGVVVARHENPAGPVVRVRTRTGSVVTLTPDHELRTPTGWKSVAALGVGGRVASIRSGGVFLDEPADPDYVVAVAYLIGDGCCGTSGYLELTSASAEVLDEYRAAASALEGKPLVVRPSRGRAKRIRASGVGPLSRRLAADGLLGKYSYQKRLPAWVFRLSRDATVLFLSRLWATDGMIKSAGSKPEISYQTSSFELGRDVRALLNKFGIPSSVARLKTSYVKGGVRKACRDGYRVRVETRAGWETFLATFSVPGKPAVDVRQVASNSNRDTLPADAFQLLRELSAATAGKHADSLRAAGLRRTPKYPPARRKAEDYVDYFRRVSPAHPRFKDLEAAVHGDVTWDEVVEIETLPDEPTWDVEVSAEHNYVLDGLVSHNSTSQASRGLLLSVVIPYFTTLYVSPLYEQIRRFSTQYVRKFIDESPLRNYWMGSSTENSVLQRSFKNFSKMFFSFATLSADRIRGISASACCFDEVQDLDPNHLPVIRETMSHSPFGAGISIYTGTPKTLDNALEYEWLRSSQAEWAIPCPACKHLNIPALDHDLLGMIGPWHEGIGPLVPSDPKVKAGTPATVCAKCKDRWIDPRTGRWLHRYPERRWDYPGYHVPQLIMPIHCEDPKRWRKLVAKQNGAENYTTAKFMNEVLGESYDVGAKLVTKTDLERAACLPWKNDTRRPEAQAALRTNYVKRVLGVDWGGGGEEEVSFTVCAVLGLTGDGRVDVLYGQRLLTPNDPVAEARELFRIYNLFGCQTLAHDYNGAGNLREVFMVNSGLSLDRVMPFVYTRTANRDPITFHKGGDGNNSRNYWLLDKARVVEYVCELIKLQQIRFFKYDYVDVDNRGLLHDFLSLVASKTETQRAGEVYNIIRIAAFPDDFAHAVTFGCAAIWHQTGVWPNVSHIANLALSAEQLAAVNPPNPWAGPLDNDYDFLGTP